MEKHLEPYKCGCLNWFIIIYLFFFNMSVDTIYQENIN